jgi:hypothetical protein
MPTETPKVEQEKVILSWIGKSKPGGDGDVKIKPVLMVLGILVAIILIFAREWMMMWVLVAGVFYYYATRKSEAMDVEFIIFNKGMSAFGKKFEWKDFTRWWWEESFMKKVLVIEVVGGLLGRLYIPVDGAKSGEIEKLMNKYVLYDKPKETWTDQLWKWVKEKFPLDNRI